MDNPLVIGILGKKILRYDQATSTNDLVRDRADAGEAEGLVITAEEQTAGRGRMSRKWIAPRGTSLQLSILLRPTLALAHITRITQMAALAVAATLREFVEPHGLTTLLKWPNDVLLNRSSTIGYKEKARQEDPLPKKCAGILVETRIEGDALAYAILGIGVNVNFSMQHFPDLAPFATTLADELGHVVERDALEGALLAKLDAYYARLRAGDNFLAEYRAGLSTLGRAVRVATPGGIEQGIAEDVDADGALLLRRNGELIRVVAGDVTILRDAR